MVDPEQMAGELLHRMLKDKTRRYDGTHNWYRVTKKKFHPRGSRQKTMRALILMLGLLGHKYEIRHPTHYNIRLVD